MYDRTFFNLNHQTKKRIILTSYLTLLTLCHLTNLAMGSPQAVADCENLLQHLYENDSNGGKAILGAMIFGPVGLLMGGGRNKEEIARELSRKGICSDYIEETYQFQRKAQEEAERHHEWLNRNKAERLIREEQEKERHLERVSYCKDMGISNIVCENHEVLFLLGTAIFLVMIKLISDRITPNQRPYHP